MTSQPTDPDDTEDVWEDTWRYHPERINPDDPIVAAERWRDERDQARQQRDQAIEALREIAKERVSVPGANWSGATPAALKARTALDHLEGK
jgi:hypothetical protein